MIKSILFTCLFCLFILSLVLSGCGTPDISDQDVHPSDSAHIDTVAFKNGSYHFPGDSWIVYDRPNELGWNEEILTNIGNYADSLETAALMVIHKGVLVYDWGATDQKYITQSMRKGLLNSLYGIYWDRGHINLDTTLAELGITDSPPLTDLEKTSTIEQLLQSTSGVYHSALYELRSWKEDKPDRGTHNPGEQWYYNNWGFNALGTIFENITSQGIGEAFENEIALPLQMQDFNSDDVAYINQDSRSEKFMGNSSEHPAYMFSTSARDMARYGLLYLNNGQWDNKQILSEEWINKSWDPVNIEMYYTLKFGYMWWIFEDGTIYVNKDMGFEDNIYFTSGDGGHATFVIPYLDLVVVHRVNEKGVDFWSQFKRGFLGIGNDVDDDEVYNLLYMIREAHPKYQ